MNYVIQMYSLQPLIQHCLLITGSKAFYTPQKLTCNPQNDAYTSFGASISTMKQSRPITLQSQLIHFMYVAK